VAEILSFFKPSEFVPDHYHRQVAITNVFSSILCIVSLAFAGILYASFGWSYILLFISLVAVLLMLVPILNKWVNYTLGRMIFCLIPVWLTMTVTILIKLEAEVISYAIFFDSRFVLMATTILPGIIFRLEERIQLMVCLGSTSLLMLFYDPIHELFGVGYFQKGFTDQSYSYLNYIVNATYLILLFGILLLRSIMERSENQLKKRNVQLVEKQNEIEAQHEELIQHQEEILSSSEKLEEANRVILQQQEALKEYTKKLEALVKEKNHDLISTNSELVKHNNELLQFSYTVSHNLRGPVARLLGLTRLFKYSENEEEDLRLQELIMRSSEELDEILKDLSLIIDIRNDLYKVKEKIYLHEVWNSALNLLGENVKSIYRIEVDFSQAPYVFGVRPMVQSIFYNLLSNAIKYQSPERKLNVKARCLQIDDNRTVVSIADNGLGIDLKNQGKNVFKLYKRFHPHISGKGLGLYLVKTQAETMDAQISVESEVDVGTTFQVTFTHPETANKQIFHDNEASQLYFDAYRNVTVIVWKKNITSKEYRDTFDVLISSLKMYKTPAWISDIRNQGFVTDEDQQWLVENIIKEALKHGLRRVAVIGVHDAFKKDYVSRIEQVTQGLNVEMRVFTSMEESLLWMEDFRINVY
jgi:signal transduction histidine kinase